jgi:hypothetical protein
MTHHRRRPSSLIAALGVSVLAVSTLAVSTLVASAGPGNATRPEQSRPGDVIVFNGEGNNLNAYAAKPPFKKQTVIRNHEDDPDGLDINAQICFFPDGSNRFVAGEDTGQPDPPQGWGIFKLSGKKVGKFSAKQVGKLTPTYQGSIDNAENYGCGFLSDGRIITTDIGNQAAGPEDGQLIVWFPPFNSREVDYCKLDIAIGTAGGIFVDDEDRVYVPSARGATIGIWRYSGPFPTSNDAAGGCASTDTTGAPMAESVTKELFIPAGENNLSTPNAITDSPKDGHLFASSVINGVINEYDADGTFVRTVLQPPASESLGETTFSTGTPLGLGVGPDGTLYYADIAITISPDGIGPGPDGKVRRIRFVKGEPQAPETMGAKLAFPDGIGIYVGKKS